MTSFNDIITENYRFDSNYFYALNYFKSENSQDQILLFKKLFYEKNIGNISLNTKTLFIIQEYSQDQNIKCICFILISLLDDKKIHTLDNALAEFICHAVNENIDNLKTVDLCFNKCPERLALLRKSPQEWYLQLNKKSYRLKTRIIQKDGNFHEERGIYIKGNFNTFASTDRTYFKETTDGEERYFDKIEIDNTEHQIEFKKDNNEYLISPIESKLKYCEGRKSNTRCNITNKEFWWCRNSKCFSANQFSSINFSEYTLLDFINILKIPLIDEHYYLFIGQMNRLNKIIEKLKCLECNKILRPSKQGKFGFYRVSLFKCTNHNCNYKEEIYLTHCYNGRCDAVVDSRESKKCKNGIYICSSCAACCSKQFYIKLRDKYEKLNISIAEKIKNIIDNEEEHLERKEVFCYSCASQLIPDNKGDYYCKPCKIKYYNNRLAINNNNLFIRSNKKYN